MMSRFVISSLSRVQRRGFRCGKHPVVVAIAGPTAIGKSSVAASLIDRWPGEIVSVDSVQVYKELDVGSAKPTKEEQERIKHHMIDIRDCSDTMSAGDFAREAKTSIDDVIDKYFLPVLVGGSTLWMDWISQGIPNAPKSNPRIETSVESLVSPYEIAGRWEDAIAAVTRNLPPEKQTVFKDIARNNWVRLKRYLVIDFAMQAATGSDSADYSFESISGTFFTGHRKVMLPTADSRSASATDRIYDPRQFFLYSNRESLYRNIERRCEEMIQMGLIEEVGKLLVQGILKPEYAVCKAIGYRQTLEYLCRESFEANDYAAFLNYLRGFATATRNYAKSQFHWYRKRDDFLWLDANRSAEQVATEIERWCQIPRDQYQMAIDMQVKYCKLKSHQRCREGDHESAIRSELDIALSEFKQRNPDVSDCIDITARFIAPEELSFLKRYVQMIGFLPVPSSVKIGSRRFSLDEELMWCHQSDEIKKYVATADKISIRMREEFPDQVRQFRKITEQVRHTATDQLFELNNQ